MLFHPSHTHLSLIEVDDLQKPEEHQPELVREHYQALMTILDWAKTFLSRPHPELGRDGAVCPYTRTSITRHHFRMAVYQEHDVSLAQVREQLLLYRNWFLALEPVQPKTEAQYKTILILFPYLSAEKASTIIDDLQRELKPPFVDAGLMIGQFHARCNEPGLWNTAFRPLRTPIPLLVIRHMVPTDFPFLRHDPVFLASYLKICGQQIPKHLQSAVQQQQQLLATQMHDQSSGDLRS